MSPELIGILTVGAILFSGVVALAGMMVTTARGLRDGLAQVSQDVKGLEGRLVAMGGQVSELRERMAHLEGLLEGLREAITHSRVAS